MNKFSLLLYAISTMLVMEVQAQQKATIFATVQQGIWHDNEKLKLQPGLTGGVKWKKWSASLSASVDFHFTRSLQAGLDLRRHFAIGKQELFVYAVPGFNLPIPSKNEKEKNAFWKQEQQFESGHYFEAGTGIMIGKKKNFFAALAWSQKTFSERYKVSGLDPVNMGPGLQTRKTDFEYNRIGMKLGFMF